MKTYLQKLEENVSAASNHYTREEGQEELEQVTLWLDGDIFLGGVLALGGRPRLPRTAVVKLRGALGDQGSGVLHWLNCGS